MPNINKLLNKVNQASQAIKSAKGIKAQIASIGYKGGINTEEVDKLQEQAEKARQDGENRRQTLQKGLSAKNSAKKKAKKKAAAKKEVSTLGDIDALADLKKKMNEENKG